MMMKRKRFENPRAMYDFSVLRDLRKRENLNIADVSVQSGISAAVISKLERNQTLAELETLFRLGRVYGMSATDLLALAERQTAHKAQTTEHDAGGFHFRQIAYGNVRALLGSARGGRKLSRPEVHQDDYEVCWVLKGKLQIVLPSETHKLQTGQAIQFDAILEHTYEALEDCELIILHIRKGKRF
ncbi:MAG: XRE family transcriptional regulator [Phycisphaerae bacterium]